MEVTDDETGLAGSTRPDFPAGADNVGDRVEDGQSQDGFQEEADTIPNLQDVPSIADDEPSSDREGVSQSVPTDRDDASALLDESGSIPDDAPSVHVGDFRLHNTRR